MGKADLHIHTTNSYDGTATVAATLEFVKRHTDLDVIAITDHDEIDGALEALTWAPAYGIQVVPGIEISTGEGHLQGLWVQQRIPPGLSLIKTLEKIAELGGLAVAPHPGHKWTGCLSAESIRQALQIPALAQVLVGGEEYNASLPYLALNRKAAHIVHVNRLAAVASSDAHMLWMIGLAHTYFPGRTAGHLRTALMERTTQAVVNRRPWYFLASYFTRQWLRSVGLAQWSPLEPGGPITLRRLAAVGRTVGAIAASGQRPNMK